MLVAPSPFIFWLRFAKWIRRECALGNRKRHLRRLPKSLESLRAFDHFGLRLGHSHTVSFSAVPFVNVLELNIHFAKHGHKFGAATPADYEALADAFLGGAMNATTQECTRPNAVDYLRFDSANRHFGVLCLTNNCVRTFYPASARLIARRGGTAAFFTFECARIV
jgi:hypothetical protein